MFERFIHGNLQKRYVDKNTCDNKRFLYPLSLSTRDFFRYTMNTRLSHPAQCRYFLIAHIICILLTFLPLQAHDTWLLPQKFRLKPEERSILALTSGMAFPSNEFAILPERVNQAFVLLAGEKTVLAKREKMPKALQFPIMLPNVGVATAFVSLLPKTLDLSPKLVREYLREIGASDSLQSVWKNVPNTDKTKRWREEYTKHTKTFVFVGKEESYRQDSSWQTPCGMTLEILPESHPGLLHPASVFPVQVLLNGKPLANFLLECLLQGKKHGIMRKTDSAGRVHFPLRIPGRYLLRGTLLQPSQSNALDWQSHFTTLTFEVQR